MNYETLSIQELKSLQIVAKQQAIDSGNQIKNKAQMIKDEFYEKMKQFVTCDKIMLRNDTVVFGVDYQYKDNDTRTYEVSIYNYKTWSNESRQMKISWFSTQASLQDIGVLEYLQLVGKLAHLMQHNNEFVSLINEYNDKLYNVEYNEFHTELNYELITKTLKTKQQEIIKDAVLARIYSGEWLTVDTPINYNKHIFSSFRYKTSTNVYHVFETKYDVNSTYINEIRIKKDSVYNEIGCYVARQDKLNYVIETSKTSGLKIPVTAISDVDYKSVLVSEIKLLSAEETGSYNKTCRCLINNSEEYLLRYDKFLSMFNYTELFELQDMN